MNKIFGKLGNIFEKRPFKSLFVALIVFVVMIVGAINISMSTGSETLVQTDNDAYISNFEMEEEFGSDAIMVLFKGDHDALLDLDNLLKLYSIEEKLQHTDGIFTLMSPASVVHQITDKQISEIKNQVPNMSNGLNEMGSMLQTIGQELKDKDLPNPTLLDEKMNALTASLNSDILLEGFDETQIELEAQFSTMSSGLHEMGSKLVDIGKELGNQEIPNPGELEKTLSEITELTTVFEQLIIGQDNLGIGIDSMGEGIQASSDGIDEVSNQLNLLAKNAPESLRTELQEIAKKLSKSTDGLNSLSDNTKQLSAGTDNTSNALLNISLNLSEELNVIKESLSMGGLDPDELQTMAQGFVVMGENLNQLSSGISEMNFDEMLPDTSTIFSSLKSDMDEEMTEIKAIFSEGLDPTELKTMADGLMTMGENLVELSDGLEMFSNKSEMIQAYFPHNQEELDNILYEEDGSLRTVFDETVIDENHIMMMIKLEGNLDDSIIDAVYEAVSEAVASEELAVEYLISGKPVLDSALRTEMQSNMILMVISAVTLMFVILSIVFKVRWKVLSLGIVFVSVIATLGLMGHLNVSMTMVSMAVFPILIGLGVDYSIQIHNRYEEEKSVTITLVQIGKAVGKAVVATVLGFISLYASPVPMIQDFGKMLTIGVIISFIGSIFLLLPILKARDLVDPKETVKTKDKKDSLMERFMSSIGKFSMKFAWIIVIVSIVFSVMGLVADRNVGVETDIETFMPQDMDALLDIHKVRDVVGSTNQMNLYFEDTDLLSEENLKWMQDIVKEIEETYTDQVVDIKSLDNLVQNMTTDDEINHETYLEFVNDIPLSQRKMFINENQNKAVILMNVEHMATEELQEFVEDIYETIKTSPMKVSVSGKSVLDVEMVKGLTDGRMKMTMLGLALVFIALLIMYRSFFKALVVVFPVVIIVGMSGGIMYLFGLKYTPITATLGALILGMGTETNIMLLERFLEERNNGMNKGDAIKTTLNKIGAATLASGLTTVGGFSVLLTSKFVILKDFGLMTVINITLELTSTFVLLPAVIWLFDRLLVKNKKTLKHKSKRRYQ